MQKPLRVGLVGAGHATRIVHLGQLRLLPGFSDVKWVGVMDTNAAEARRLATDLNVPAFGDLSGLASVAEAVLVAVPDAYHVPVTLEALGLGLHVLCEKPPAEDLTGAQAMVQAARTAGRVLAVNVEHRVRALQVRAAFGRVDYAICVWRRPVDPQYDSGVTVPRSAIGDLAIHPLDVGWTLAGCPRPTTAVAVSRDPRAMIESTAMGLVTCEGDVGLTIHVDSAAFVSEETVVVESYGERYGRIPLMLRPVSPALRPDYMPTLWERTPQGCQRKDVPPALTEGECLAAVWRNFAAACRGLEDSFISLEQIEDLQWMFGALRASARLGGVQITRP